LCGKANHLNGLRPHDSNFIRRPLHASQWRTGVIQAP
jgi:hypothetical protein